jgi:hypothetical protein
MVAAADYWLCKVKGESKGAAQELFEQAQQQVNTCWTLAFFLPLLLDSYKCTANSLLFYRYFTATLILLSCYSTLQEVQKKERFEKAQREANARQSMPSPPRPAKKVRFCVL